MTLIQPYFKMAAMIIFTCDVTRQFLIYSTSVLVKLIVMCTGSIAHSVNWFDQCVYVKIYALKPFEADVGALSPTIDLSTLSTEDTAVSYTHLTLPTKRIV